MKKTPFQAVFYFGVMGYQLKTGQNKELTAIFLYHRLMTKKTEQHRKYAQLVTQLSLKLQQQASKLFVT
ncbi:MAG: hypothetical protein Q9M50_13845 [Methylococcales bacterium]|nr:hypothetical protein [Methylococcales bacterium]